MNHYESNNIFILLSVIELFGDTNERGNAKRRGGPYPAWKQRIGNRQHSIDIETENRFSIGLFHPDREDRDGEVRSPADL